MVRRYYEIRSLAVRREQIVVLPQEKFCFLLGFCKELGPLIPQAPGEDVVFLEGSADDLLKFGDSQLVSQEPVPVAGKIDLKNKIIVGALGLSKVKSSGRCLYIGCGGQEMVGIVFPNRNLRFSKGRIL